MDKIQLIQGDITQVMADAIVNAANHTLLGGGGVDGAIHRAGGPEILEECMAISERQGGCETGEAVVTTGGDLLCQYVIHTVGPIWNGGEDNEDNLLENCYKNSLKLAVDYGLKVIAFPNISTGVYRFPKVYACRIALKAVNDFLEENETIQKIKFVCFDEENYELYEQALKQIPQ